MIEEVGELSLQIHRLCWQRKHQLFLFTVADYAQLQANEDHIDLILSYLDLLVESVEQPEAALEDCSLITFHPFFVFLDVLIDSVFVALGHSGSSILVEMFQHYPLNVADCSPRNS